jgi:hypothetical protein
MNFREGLAVEQRVRHERLRTMKTFSCILLLLAAAGAHAQTEPPAAAPVPNATVPNAINPPVPRRTNAIPGPPQAVLPPLPVLSKIDLDFQGGTPAALIDVLSRSLGKRVNAIIDDSDAKVQLPAIHVRNADLTSIFTAMATATAKQVAIPTSSHMGGTVSYQYQNVQSQFVPPPGGGVTDDTVWSFVSNESDAQTFLDSTKTTQRALKHFQLGPYLNEKLTVEDITTAIRTGWEMLETQDKPELKFHKETGILLAAGDAKLLEQIPQVLLQLPRAPGSPEFPGTTTPGRTRRSTSSDPFQPTSEGARP